jgi:hypothetical protein
MKHIALAHLSLWDQLQLEQIVPVTILLKETLDKIGGEILAGELQRLPTEGQGVAKAEGLHADWAIARVDYLTGQQT